MIVRFPSLGKLPQTKSAAAAAPAFASTMCDIEQFDGFPHEFSGVARLFPLPNLVMFPHVVQPLHIFEPRYREMMEDALAGDKLIAMALLAPGWERNYDGRPAVSPVVCVGGIVAHCCAEDGCYNLLLRGLGRARLRWELPPTRLFRSAEVELLEDCYSPLGSEPQPELRRCLLNNLRRGLSCGSAAHEQIDQLLDADLPLGVLTDVVAYAVDMPLAAKQELLAEPVVERRAAKLIRRLECGSVAAHASRGFPPDFSAN